MFKIAVAIGIYSYLIFVIGISGFLFPQIIAISTILFLIFCVLFFGNSTTKKIHFKFKYREIGLLIILIAMGGVNLIGALGPELAFDALWYHLTIPKEFILQNKIFYIPGNLLYYSAMPMLTEMLYIPALVFGNEMAAKIIHYMLGILTCIVIYKFARLYLDRFYSILAVVIFYSNLVVGWLSITAFSDLSRTFFEILSFYLFATFLKTKNKTFFYQSAIILGLAVCSKILALESIVVYVLLLVFYFKSKKTVVIKLLQFIGIVLGVSLPWFLFAYFSTGNPLFPIFSEYYTPETSLNILNPIEVVKSLVSIFLFSQDPLSPIYIMVFPLLLKSRKQLFEKNKELLVFLFVTIFIWYVTPQSGGGRFITAYLPVYSIISALLIFKYNFQLKKILLCAVYVIAIVSIFYRGAANSKFLPVILGITGKDDFLMQNLNFEFGDFYDEKNDIKKIVLDEKVLLVGLHNLYYVDFLHDDISWSRNKKYSYILTQNQVLDKSKYINYLSVYKNRKTHVTLYKLNEKDN